MVVNNVFVFDLDDTLYKELDFLKSAFKLISSIIDKRNSVALYNKMLFDYYEGKNVFQNLVQINNKYSIDSLLNIYRAHYPEISLDIQTKSTLNLLKKKGKTGLITDGRSITQRNKINALGLGNFFDKIIISEEIGYSKPDIRLYEQFHEFNSYSYYYIANDTSKDFLAPNSIGWDTICVLDRNNINISKQDFTLDNMYLPKYKVNEISEIMELIQSK